MVVLGKATKLRLPNGTLVTVNIDDSDGPEMVILDACDILARNYCPHDAECECSCRCIEKWEGPNGRWKCQCTLIIRKTVYVR